MSALKVSSGGLLGTLQGDRGLGAELEKARADRAAPADPDSSEPLEQNSPFFDHGGNWFFQRDMFAHHDGVSKPTGDHSGQCWTDGDTYVPHPGAYRVLPGDGEREYRTFIQDADDCTMGGDEHRWEGSSLVRVHPEVPAVMPMAEARAYQRFVFVVLTAMIGLALCVGGFTASFAGTYLLSGTTISAGCLPQFGCVIQGPLGGASEVLAAGVLAWAVTHSNQPVPWRPPSVVEEVAKVPGLCSVAFQPVSLMVCLASVPTGVAVNVVSGGGWLSFGPSPTASGGAGAPLHSPPPQLDSTEAESKGEDEGEEVEDLDMGKAKSEDEDEDEGHAHGSGEDDKPVPPAGRARNARPPVDENEGDAFVPSWSKNFGHDDLRRCGSASSDGSDGACGRA